MLINTMRLRSPHLAARVMGEASHRVAALAPGQSLRNFHASAPVLYSRKGWAEDFKGHRRQDMCVCCKTLRNGCGIG